MGSGGDGRGRDEQDPLGRDDKGLPAGVQIGVHRLPLGKAVSKDALQPFRQPFGLADVATRGARSAIHRFLAFGDLGVESDFPQPADDLVGLAQIVGRGEDPGGSLDRLARRVPVGQT